MEKKQEELLKKSEWGYKKTQKSCFNTQVLLPMIRTVYLSEVPNQPVCFTSAWNQLVFASK